ncbi:MAG: hypothetical protein ACTSVE_06335 [Candidatus Helarchaeota archaeon]
MVDRWEFNFGTVEITGEKIIVDAKDSYKNIFQKKYKDITEAKIGKEAEKVIKHVWDKGKRKSESINFLIKQEIQELFEAIASAEGVSAHRVAEEGADADAYKDTDFSDDVTNKFDVRIDEIIELKMKKEEILESTISGKLQVLNNGEKNRIWDIDLELSGTDKTNLENQKYHILDLDPQEDWTQDYEIKIEDAEAPLVIKESIDITPDSEETSLTFILDQEHEPLFSIELKNTSSSVIKNIELTKKIAEDFKDIEIKEKEMGDVNKESDLIIWKLDELEPDQSAKLDFTVKVTPTGKDPISSGEIEVKYVLPEETFSGLKIEHVDAYSDNIYYVERDEREEEPDIWDCKFIFKNRSEFPLKLLDVDLKSGDYNTEEKVVDLGPQLDPDVIVNPGQEWVSEPWEIESEDLPTFGKNVQFTVVGDVINQLSALVLIEPIELPVLTLTGTKEFDKKEIASFRKSELNATILIETSGKAPIDKFHIEDTIPSQFEVQEGLKIVVGETEIADDNISVSYEPSENIEDERKMIIDVENIMESVGTLEDETKISINYPLNATKPTKDTEYEAPLIFQAITQDGSIIEAEIIPEPITVVHQRRRYSDGRVIQQGATKGEYNIIVIHKNRSDAAEENKVFTELIPEDFELVSTDPEAEQDGNKLTWTFETIEPGSEVTIEFTIRGTGDYKARNAQISHSG